MQITSLYFIFLSVLSIFIYYKLSQKFRIIFLTFLSCGFIASYSYILLAYVVLYSFINYYIGLKIPLAFHRKRWFVLGIIINLTQLVILKYTTFTFDPLLNLINCSIHLSRISDIIIPVGVSFFTLQGIGYLININLKWEKPELNFLHFLLYITFYPKFLSGPIERSNRFLTQLKSVQSFNERDVTEGLRMVMLGLFKKIAIAQQLAPLVNNGYSSQQLSGDSSGIIVFLIQPLYIYFDFSGYTDIALGLAKTLGIKLQPNFERPFLAENVSNFWKRFHISLSSWFHDYIFIRTSYKYRNWGIYASILAIFITWILFGIWHGAGWNFMLLGLLQALAIVYEFFTKKWRFKLFAGLPQYVAIWSGRLITYLFYCVSLVFFFAPDIKSVYQFYTNLFRTKLLIINDMQVSVLIMTLFFISIFLILEILDNDFNRHYKKFESLWTSQKKLVKVSRWSLYFFFVAIIIVLSNEVQQFIYFQF